MRLDAARINRFDSAITSTSPEIAQVNTVGYPARTRLSGSVNWGHGLLDASMAANYVSGYPDTSAPTPREVSPYTTINVAARYSLPSRIKLSAAVINLFNRLPPYVYSGSPGFPNSHYDPANANPVGRTLAITVSKNLVNPVKFQSTRDAARPMYVVKLLWGLTKALYRKLAKNAALLRTAFARSNVDVPKHRLSASHWNCVLCRCGRQETARNRPKRGSKACRSAFLCDFVHLIYFTVCSHTRLFGRFLVSDSRHERKKNKSYMPCLLSPCPV